LDLLRGELSPAEAAALSARVQADPALRAERDRLAALLRRAGEAHDLPVSAADAARVAARVRHRVQREDARVPAAPAGRRFLWPRVLAAAVGAHVVVLGLLALFAGGDAPAPRERDAVVRLAPDPTPGSFPADDFETPEPSLALAQPMPIEDVLRDLPGVPLSDDVLPAGPSDPAVGSALPAFARAGLFRSDPHAKYAILARVGARADLATVEESLRSLAAEQAPDGSFAAARRAAGPGAGPEAGSETPPGSVRVTGTVLLAFLGDGHTSRSGAHREVVERGVAWLRAHAPRATALEDRAIAAVALTEDYAFGRGQMTPAEARARADEARALVAATAAAARGERGASPWVALALDAGARAGLAGPGGDRAWAVAYAALPHPDASDPRTAVLEGTALLLARKAEVFRAWNRRASTALKARLRAGADVEETALIVLALEVPYRTY
jgi:hypothetical protein